MRLNILLVGFILLFSLTLYRVFDLSIEKNHYFLKLAENQKQYGNYGYLRGEIFIQDKLNNKLVTVATNKSSEDGYSRFYPEKNLASSVLGFWGFKGKIRIGQYGLESFYEPWLSGVVGSNDGLLGKINFTDNLFNNSKFKKGSSLILTIDKNVQFFVEKKLRELIEKWDAAGGNVIIQDPQTGAILAMADFPDFDPNKYYEYDLSYFINSNIQKRFEPGSSFKTITMAAALDTGAVTPETTYFDSGEVKVAGYTIENFDLKSNGYQTMTQVLEKSINTGAIYAMRQTSKDKFLEYVERFRFDKKTDIDLSGEVSGDIKNLYTGREINFVTASFGQGISVTPMQLVNAYSAIANGGKLMRPYVVEKIIKPDGKVVEIKPEVVAEPVNKETADKLSLMLVSVVEHGLVRGIKVDGYKIAAKTGTAQEPDLKGGYSEFLIHNLVGFGPVGNPRFTILLKLDRPKGVEVAAASLARAFGDIVKYLISYYEILPSE